MKNFLLPILVLTLLTACGGNTPQVPKDPNPAKPTEDNIDKIARSTAPLIAEEDSLAKKYNDVLSELSRCTNLKLTKEKALENSVGPLMGDQLNDVWLDSASTQLDSCIVDAQLLFDELPENHDDWRYSVYKKILEDL